MKALQRFSLAVGKAGRFNVWEEMQKGLLGALEVPSSTAC